MKFLLALILAVLIPACSQSGGKQLECNSAGLVDLDATWRAQVYKHTLVTWPDSGNTEIRQDDGVYQIIADQCGPHIMFFGMVGEVDTLGASLHIDITSVSWPGLKYTVTGDGYIDQDSGWITVQTDYDYVVYDSTFTILLSEKIYD